MTRHVDILGCRFRPWTTDETLLRVEEIIQRNQRDYLCTVNVAILMMMRRDTRLRGYIDRSGLTVADGQPLIWASRLLGYPLPARVTGVDLVSQIAELAARRDWRIYLLGATSAVVRVVSETLRSRYPGLVIAGAADGYFGLDKADERAAAIRESGAKILIVGMGVPRQEYFIDRHWDDLGVNLAIGVGGSFDVVSGVTKRAPSWMQRSGLEWLYRTLQEPRRLFWRYLTTNSQFLFHLLSMLITGRFRRQGK